MMCRRGIADEPVAAAHVSNQLCTQVTRRSVLYGFQAKARPRLTGENTCSLSPKLANRTMYEQATDKCADGV